jgi:hypothetical protein
VNPTSWMSETVSALQSLGEPPSETSSMSLSGASALPDASTTSAPFSAKNYCEENILVCVLPPVGAMIVICVGIAWMRHSKRKARAAIETVQENMIAQHTHQQNWFKSQEDHEEPMNTFGTLHHASSIASPSAANHDAGINLDDDDDDDADSDLDLGNGGGENLDQYFQNLEFQQHDL